MGGDFKRKCWKFGNFGGDNFGIENFQVIKLWKVLEIKQKNLNLMWCVG